MLDRAIRTLAEPSGTLAHVATCSINLSGQSLTDLKVYDYIHQLLKSTGVDPHRLCFEITESSVIANMDVAQQFVGGLRKLGCRFALDDFGSGLSTFDYLKQLEVDYVKLDGQLMHSLTEDIDLQNKVREIVKSASDLQILTIAERVENANTMAVLFQVGVHFMQGHYVHEPEVVLQ